MIAATNRPDVLDPALARSRTAVPGRDGTLPVALFQFSASLWRCIAPARWNPSFPRHRPGASSICPTPHRCSVQVRPGRFDRKVVVPSPDAAGRLQILQVHTRKKPLDADVDLHEARPPPAGRPGHASRPQLLRALLRLQS